MTDLEQFLANRSRSIARMTAANRGGRPDLRVQNAAGDEATIYLYDVIDPWWGVSADMVRAELDAITAPRIAIHVNSIGGDVFEAIAIFNLIRARKETAHIDMHNDSVALSAASFIMLAGHRSISAPHSQWMIHEAMGFAGGYAEDMRKAAEFLDRQTEVIAGIYAERGHTVEHWLGLMRAETWFTAEEAVAAGLADEVAGEAAAQNRYDLGAFRNAPRSESPRAQDTTTTSDELAQEHLRFQRSRSRLVGAA